MSTQHKPGLAFNAARRRALLDYAEIQGMRRAGEARWKRQHQPGHMPECGQAPDAWGLRPLPRRVRIQEAILIAVMFGVAVGVLVAAANGWIS